MIRYNIKQMVRTPIKTFFFILIIILSSGILSLGVNLWSINQTKMKQYENEFLTVGIVEQEKMSIRQNRLWDAELGDYKIYQGPQYGKAIPLSVLDFKGSNYIEKPEFRPYYLSYSSQYHTSKSDEEADMFVAEIEVKEDCVPDHSVPVIVSKFLSEPGAGYHEGMTIWFCNHFQPDPQPLLAGKRYVVYMMESGSVHGPDSEQTSQSEATTVYEYKPVSISSSQADETGQLIPGDVSRQNVDEEKDSIYYEVTDGFYESDVGKYYLELVNAFKYMKQSIPVTGTNATMLLLPFYNKEAYIVEGNDISHNEYATGAKVCLVSEEFANNNHLKTGDDIDLSLYVSAYGMSASEGSGIYTPDDLLNADGELFSTFYKCSYKVVGIYRTEAGVIGNNKGLANDEVILPSKSIEESDKENIMYHGHLTGTTTSFQIPNGKVEQFMEKWNDVGTNELNIVFYDMGYTQIKHGLDNLKKVSNIMIIVGCILTLVIMVMYSYIYVVQQKINFAIQRSLGVIKRKCMINNMIGVFVILAAGVLVGGIGGNYIVNYFSLQAFSTNFYETIYSSNLMYLNETALKDVNFYIDRRQIYITAICILLMIVVGMTIISKDVRKSLKYEPINLLSRSRE